MIWKDLASWNAIQGCHQPQIFRFQSFFFCNGNSLLHAAKLHHSDAFLVDFILELRTEADLEISSPDVVESKVFKQGSIFRDVSFSQTFQIRNFLKSPVDKNTAKVKLKIDDFPQTVFKFSMAVLQMSVLHVLIIPTCSLNPPTTKYSTGLLMYLPNSVLI